MPIGICDVRIGFCCRVQLNLIRNLRSEQLDSYQDLVTKRPTVSKASAVEITVSTN